jgi:hypothetical protein
MTVAGRPPSIWHFSRAATWKSAFPRMQNLPRGDRAFSAATPKMTPSIF